MKNTIEKPVKKLEVGTMFFIDMPNAIYACDIVRMTEKAVQVDICVTPVWGGSNGGGAMIYSWGAWIPKSQIITDNEGDMTVKKWFRSKINKFHIKRYTFIGEKKVFI